MRRFVPLACLALALAGAAAPAAPLREEASGTVFGGTQTVAGTPVECLGTGLRKVFIFKVYALAYCLEPKEVGALAEAARRAHPGLEGRRLAEALEADGSFFTALEDAPGVHLVVMKALRDFTREQMGDAFRKSLKDVLTKAQVDELMRAIPADAKEGDRVRIFGDGRKLTIDVAGRRSTVDDPEVARRLWRVWLGPDSVTPSLRHQLARRAAMRLSNG